MCVLLRKYAGPRSVGILRGAWKWLLRAMVLLLLLLALVIATAQQWMPAVGEWLSYPPRDVPAKADAIIVYGGNIERTEYGIDLYLQGVAPELWRTGYASSRESLTRTVTSAGVSASDFHWLETYSTWQDGTRIAQTIEQNNFERVVLVTDWWHSRRALCTTQIHLGNHDVEVYYTPSPTRMADRPDNWWQHRRGWQHVVSELAKFGYYWPRYGMNPWEC
jgi:uncharacterized SAM-binding protein YcdF (DUF218 family)